VDGLEAKVAQLEATQFSTTTRLKGQATFDIGAYSYGGSFNKGPSNTGPGLNGAPLWDALVFNYDLRLNFDTSFTGRDLLLTRLRAGNFSNGPFGGGQYIGTNLDISFQGPDPQVVMLDRLYYVFPAGDEFRFTIAARARNNEMLAIIASAYNSALGDFFYGDFGTPGVHNKATGSAVGVTWNQKVPKGRPRLAGSLSYVAENANSGDPSTGGVMSDGSAGNFTAQFGGTGQQWALVGAYRYGQCGTNIRSGTQFSYAASKLACASLGDGASTNNVAVNGYWQPLKSGWLPSVTAGWGLTSFSQGYDVSTNPFNVQTAQSWMVGLEWKDVFLKGNNAGMAVGQQPFATSRFDGDTPYDSNYAWEWWYQYQISDNISVTPSLFYLSRPAGQNTPLGETFNAFGGLVQIQFMF